MPRNEYPWSIDDPPSLAPHSLAKHRILRRYIETYIRVLTANPRTDILRLYLVDGFAGGSIYVDPKTNISQPGSPTILLDAVRCAEAAANLVRAKPLRVDARFFFIDDDPAAISCLNAVLKKRDTWPVEREQVNVIPGKFEDHLGDVIRKISGSRGTAKRTIFVLDLYGYTAAPPVLLRSIFEMLPRAEVFLTLAVGWAAAYLRDLRTVAEKLGIARDVLDRLAADGDAGPSLDEPGVRPTLMKLQILLKDVFTTEIGTTCYTPFFIVSRESNRCYWFLHMANSPRANDVVKALHWEVENHFDHFGGEGLGMLGYDPAKDPDVTGQPLLPFCFDGAAQTRTRSALARTLSARINANFPDGVSLDNLYAHICNETPADQTLLSDIVRDLCSEGELQKCGAEGERRAPSTPLRGNDIIRVSAQVRFSFPHR
jgi:three-Cys-motif partner protein